MLPRHDRRDYAQNPLTGPAFLLVRALSQKPLQKAVDHQVQNQGHGFRSSFRKRKSRLCRTAIERTVRKGEQCCLLILSAQVKCLSDHACTHGFDLQAHKGFEDNFWATKMNLMVRARA